MLLHRRRRHSALLVWSLIGGGGSTSFVIVASPPGSAHADKKEPDHNYIIDEMLSNVTELVARIGLRQTQRIHANASTVLTSRHIWLANPLWKPHESKKKFLLIRSVFAAVESHRTQATTRGLKRSISARFIQKLLCYKHNTIISAAIIPEEMRFFQAKIIVL